MPSDFNISQAAASVYAESLLQLAQEAGLAEDIGVELRELKELWQRDPSFAALMCSAAFEVDVRRQLIRTAFGGRVHQLVLNLLLVMNDKRRSMILPAVCDAYRHKLDQAMQREVVFVTSAAPLDDAQRTKIRQEIKRLTGHESDLLEETKPELLGGLRVQVGDQLFDMSVERRLREIRSALLASVEQHMLAGVDRFVAG
jgi:F-type H+-transporting ATPase subunit delta